MYSCVKVSTPWLFFFFFFFFTVSVTVTVTYTLGLMDNSYDG